MLTNYLTQGTLAQQPYQSARESLTIFATAALISMYNIRLFLNSLWQLLPAANLASDYHPCREVSQLLQPLRTSATTGSTVRSEAAQQPVPQRLDKPVRSFACYVRGYSSLPLTDRALVALRSGHLSKAFHILPDITLAALDYGLQPSDTQLIANGRYAPGWSLREQLLIRVTDDLYRKHEINERAWKRLTKLYSHNQILDIIFCAAAFHLCTL